MQEDQQIMIILYRYIVSLDDTLNWLGQCKIINAQYLNMFDNFYYSKKKNREKKTVFSVISQILIYSLMLKAFLQFR